VASVWLIILQACTWIVWRFTSFYVYIADFGQQTEITLQDVPNAKYQLDLFVGINEIELERKDSRTWTPAQRLYVLYFLTAYTGRSTYIYRDVSPTSQMHVKVQMKRAWVKKEGTSKVIGLQKLFNDYWTSEAHEITVPGPL